MITSNYSKDTTLTAGSEAPKKNYKNAVIGILAVALLGVSSYAIYSNSENGTKISKQETVIAQAVVEKSSIQKSFDESLARIESMKTLNASLETKLADNNTEIEKTKSEIRTILNKSNATAAELKKARNLVADLNTKISGMQQEVARLTQENQLLVLDKNTLTMEKEKLSQDLTATTTVKQELEKKVDVASTLNASNISVTPVNVKGNGKEKVTSTAKRVDKLVISFDVDNRIVQPGTTDVYVCVIAPDGKAINAATTGGQFATREDGDKLYTAKVAVDLETAKRKNVEFALTPSENFQQGNYKIEIYQNGFKIGESTSELKKGGLFS